MSFLLRQRLSLAFLCASTLVTAQENTVATGGDASGSGGSLSHSVGQVAYTAPASGTGSIAQGVQQPYAVIPTSLEAGPDGQLLLTAFPNPASDLLTVHANAVISPEAVARLFAADGRLVLEQRLKGADTAIDLKPLAPGSYTLSVRDGERPLGTFTVIKH